MVGSSPCRKQGLGQWLIHLFKLRQSILNAGALHDFVGGHPFQQVRHGFKWAVTPTKCELCDWQVWRTSAPFAVAVVVANVNLQPLHFFPRLVGRYSKFCHKTSVVIYSPLGRSEPL